MKNRLTQMEAFEKETGRQQKQNYFLDLKTSQKEKNKTKLLFLHAVLLQRNIETPLNPIHILVLGFNNRS